ncbi:hypothetical protein EYC80_005012 [Monilinia laxa]|uniref:Uncharacterized protein n=1 Tax=Monilinia laxa TaxID=61186 RepID=A0A5N6KIL8_MONLA|nr:hypothetical protein EYC80_005012 [Monilinia laxa]
MHATLNSISKKQRYHAVHMCIKWKPGGYTSASRMGGLCTGFLPCHVISIRHHFPPLQPIISVAIPTMKIHFSSKASKI